MAYGSAHSSTLPTVGVTTGPTYATQINAAITELRATVDQLVTPAGMSINADLSFLTSGTYYAATNVERIALQNKGAVINATTYPTSVFIANGELYFNDASGRQVQITTAGALNISSSGGITGAGYGASSVEVNWDSGNAAYRMRSGAATDAFADVVLDDVLLNDGSGNYIRMTAQAMAADYTLTLPSAVPASTLPVVMSSAGTLSTTGTLSNLVAITTSGAAVIGTTLSAGGLITATAGLTAAVDQHLTVSGTGRLKHGTLVKNISPAGASLGAGAGTSTSWVTLDANPESCEYPIDIESEKRITRVRLRLRQGAADTVRVTLARTNTDGTVTTVATADSVTAGGAIWNTVDISGLTETVADLTHYYVDVTHLGPGTDAIRCGAVSVSYDHP